jgi:hypothetical protein
MTEFNEKIRATNHYITILNLKMAGENDLNIVETSEESDETVSDDDAEVVTTEELRRDEVREIRKMSSKDTFRLRLWRIVVTGVLLLTALTVTLTTYALLQQQEEKNFQTAVRFHIRLPVWQTSARRYLLRFHITMCYFLSLSTSYRY